MRIGLKIRRSRGGERRHWEDYHNENYWTFREFFNPLQQHEACNWSTTTLLSICLFIEMYFQVSSESIIPIFYGLLFPPSLSLCGQSVFFSARSPQDAEGSSGPALTGILLWPAVRHWRKCLYVFKNRIERFKLDMIMAILPIPIVCHSYYVLVLSLPFWLAGWLFDRRRQRHDMLQQSQRTRLTKKKQKEPTCKQSQ